MHIAFITPEYPHANFKGNIGGIGTFTKNIAEALLQKGEHVTVFVHSQDQEKVFLENDIEIHFIKKKKLKGGTWLTNRLYFNKYVNKVIKEQKIEVIEAPEWTGFTAFMNFICPLVIRLHGSDTYFCYLDKRKVKFKNKFFEKKALLGADKLIGVSNFVGEKTKLLFNLKQKIETVHNSIDVEDFLPNHNKIEPKTLLYYGTIIRKKGVFEIANMFNFLVEKDAEITLCFLGRDHKENGISTIKMIRSLLSKKALTRFTYLEAVPYKEVKNRINKTEVVLLPSFAEAFPMTWLEAMAMEKKLVTSNIGWAKELMTNGVTGFMVDPTDTDTFVARVLELISDTENSERMAKKARQTIVDNFDINQKNIENIKIYEELR